MKKIIRTHSLLLLFLLPLIPTEAVSGVDYQNFCRLMANGGSRDYRAGFRNLRDEHHQRLEKDYFSIKCSFFHAPVFEYATLGGNINGIGAMIRYLKLMEKKHHKTYVEPILNYIEPDKPHDLVFLDVLKMRIKDGQRNGAPWLEPYQDFYKRVVKLGAKHSYYTCLDLGMDVSGCLAQ